MLTGALFWKVHILGAQHRFCNQIGKKQNKKKQQKPQPNNNKNPAEQSAPPLHRPFLSRTVPAQPRAFPPLRTQLAPPRARPACALRMLFPEPLSMELNFVIVTFLGAWRTYHRLPPFGHPAPACCDRAGSFLDGQSCSYAFALFTSYTASP